ncbi:MAG: hypothetical protein JWO52_7821 [Gammaproteobacteria bacterium]|nr:hypothetical protein [Gammaproteobacteria bacterium]
MDSNASLNGFGPVILCAFIGVALALGSTALAAKVWEVIARHRK